MGTFTVAQNFTLAPTTTTTPAQVILPGAPAVYLLQLAPAGSTFTAPITLSATGLPPGATYTFNPPIVTPGAAAATTAFTVNTMRTTATLWSPTRHALGARALGPDCVPFRLPFLLPRGRFPPPAAPGARLPRAADGCSPDCCSPSQVFRGCAAGGFSASPKRPRPSP